MAGKTQVATKMAAQYAVTTAVKSSIGGPIAAIGAACALFLVLILLMVAVVTGMQQPSASAMSTAGSGEPTSYAKEIIPAAMLDLYRSSSVKEQCPGLSWTVVAAIIHLESADNRNPGLSSAGARGASQFMPTTWDSQGRASPTVGPYGKIPNGQGYGMDGDGDGIADIMNPFDSVPATARMICANGGGKAATLPNAIYAYNHAWWYVNGGIDDYGNDFVGVLPLAAKLEVPLTAGPIGALGLPIARGLYTVGNAFGETGSHWASTHTGQDLRAPTGTPVQAVANGEIVSATWDPVNYGWAGNRIVLRLPDGTEIWYCHLNSFAIRSGLVGTGITIGYVGSTGNTTGPHLHIEVHTPDGTAVDPVPFFRNHGTPL